MPIIIKETAGRLCDLLHVAIERTNQHEAHATAAAAKELPKIIYS